MTLNETVEYINIALNYPALTYSDLKLFLDMAIAELNTTLHTRIPSVAKMIEEYRKHIIPEFDNDVISLNTLPADLSIPVFEVTITDSTHTLVMDDADIEYFFNKEDGLFYTVIKTLSGGEYTYTYIPHDRLKGLHIREDGEFEVYEATYYGGDICLWVKNNIDNVTNCIITDYLPEEWIMLWLIPYVCFKYTVRDGGTAQTFAEELTQGFQQLQETYDVPNEVLLATYADKPAYTDIVKKSLPNLNIKVPTRAIFEDMIHSRNTNAIFGGFYDRGGF